jgi:hypothetical protein
MKINTGTNITADRKESTHLWAKAGDRHRKENKSGFKSHGALGST